MLKALAIAKLNYVGSVFEICAEFGCRTFASIVETDACPTATGGLRKDYAYLFERFFYFLEDKNSAEQGIVVFDELEKSEPDGQPGIRDLELRAHHRPADAGRARWGVVKQKRQWERRSDPKASDRTMITSLGAGQVSVGARPSGGELAGEARAAAVPADPRLDAGCLGR